MKFVVLGGAGAMGQVIVADLCEFAPAAQIVIADFNQDRAEQLKASLSSKQISTAFADIQDIQKMVSVLKEACVVINSTPYQFNCNVMEAALTAGCHYIDLGGLFHVTRQQLELHSRFAEKNLLAVLGMGAAPGITNVMAAHAAKDFDTIDSIDIVIGCIDFAQVNHPFYPPYSLDTILDEYTKEPMVFENGQFRAVDPMSGQVSVDFPEPVGIAPAILTLHSEVATLPLSYQHQGIQNVTFRLGLPAGFHQRLQFLVDLGLAGTEPISIAGSKVEPRQVLAKLIANFPTPTDDPDDCEVIRVDVAGTRGDRKILVRMETTVCNHAQWKISCGALDTGVPPSIVAQMIAGNQIPERGVLPPEACIPAQPFFDELAKRTIVMRKISHECLSPSRSLSNVR